MERTGTMAGKQRRPAQEMFESLSEMAAELFGEDENEERENYVTAHMRKMGYRARVVFEDADEDEGGNGGDSFTGSLFGSGGRQRREVGGRERQRGSGFGGGQYRDAR